MDRTCAWMRRRERPRAGTRAPPSGPAAARDRRGDHHGLGLELHHAQHVGRNDRLSGPVGQPGGLVQYEVGGVSVPPDLRETDATTPVVDQLQHRLSVRLRLGQGDRHVELLDVELRSECLQQPGTVLALDDDSLAIEESTPQRTRADQALCEDAAEAVTTSLAVVVAANRRSRQLWGCGHEDPRSIGVRRCPPGRRRCSGTVGANCGFEVRSVVRPKYCAEPGKRWRSGRVHWISVWLSLRVALCRWCLAGPIVRTPVLVTNG